MHEKGLWHSFKEPAVVGKKQMWSPCAIHHGIAAGHAPRDGAGAICVRCLEIMCNDNVVDKNILMAMKSTKTLYPSVLKPPLWDFVMTCGDGVRISLHPEAERWW